MARNPNNRHVNRHTSVLGTSGSGKTRWLTKHPDIKRCQRVVLWDPEEDHRAIHCRTRRDFAWTLIQAIDSGRKFRVAYVPDNVTPEEFEWWAGVVWAMLDGDEETVAIVEEVADVAFLGKATRNWGFLSRKGRKYGLRLFVVSQRPQEVDKTTLGMCPYKWAGALETELDRKAVGRVLSVSPAELARAGELNQPGRKLHFWFKEPGAAGPKFQHFDPR